MDGAADLFAEDVVDHPVLLEARAAGELVRNHDRPEVVTASGQVLDRDRRPGNRRLDALFELLCAGHCRQSSDVDDRSGPRYTE